MDRYSVDYKLSRTQPHRLAREGMHFNASKLDCKRHLKHAEDVHARQAGKGEGSCLEIGGMVRLFGPSYPSRNGPVSDWWWCAALAVHPNVVAGRLSWRLSGFWEHVTHTHTRTQTHTCTRARRKTHGTHDSDFYGWKVQPIPPGVTFSTALAKLKAQSLIVSFH